jgi:hypothetical protein
MLESVEGRIERALLDGQRAPGDLLDAEEHSVAMELPERDRLEDEEVERSGEEAGLVVHVTPMLVRRVYVRAGAVVSPDPRVASGEWEWEWEWRG